MRGFGVRGRIRTAGVPLRRRTLYPAEVHEQIRKILSLTSDICHKTANNSLKKFMPNLCRFNIL